MSGALETFATAKMRTLMPRLVTRREIIKDVAERYRESYPDDEFKTIHGRVGDTLEALGTLDLSNATREDVAAVIGNDSWTELKCGVCELDRDAVVSVPREYDPPLAVCESCAAGVLAIFEREDAR